MLLLHHHLVSLAGLAYFIGHVVATPLPVFGLSSSSAKKPAKPPKADHLIQQHMELMKAAHSTFDLAIHDKINEYIQAGNLAKKGHPVIHSRPIQHNGVHHNKEYQEAVKQVKSNHPYFDIQHRQLTRHIDTLANHKNPQAVKGMIKEASAVHSAYRSTSPLLKEHIDDDIKGKAVDMTGDKGKGSVYKGKINRLSRIFSELPDYSRLQ